MNIKEIQIDNLFNDLSIKLPLKESSNISILYGPNGLGKTTLLTMIDALFNMRPTVLEEIPFTRFYVAMTNGEKLQLIKKNNTVRTTRNYLHGHIKSQIRSMELMLTDAKGRSIAIDFASAFTVSISRYGLPTWYKQIDVNIWLDRRTGERRTTEQLAARYPQLRNEMESLASEQVKIDAVKRFLLENRVCFIDTQRLVDKPRERARDVDEEIQEAQVLAVEKCSQKLMARISRVSLEYATKSQSLERTFPHRLLGHRNSYKRTRQLLSKLYEQEEYRKELFLLGLAPESHGLGELKDPPPEFRKVLSLFVKDTDEKLKVYQDLHGKVKLFMGMISRRFASKTMRISAANGIQFYGKKGTLIPLRKLSSGEQHELVILYNLLLEMSPRTCVLIDEPEISLHVCWQEEFLKDLQGIADLVQHNFLIATHSPSIINGHWELGVELRDDKNTAN